ncbi:MAG: NCS2 family permease [Bdellovibrionales bacterium]|nr:NCS2 family permease [Bdellovibrionales bacterium]
MKNQILKNKEVLGGITTFLTMSYIVIVNPSILATEGTGMPFSGVLTATVLTCFVSTLLMGLYAKLPYGVAPGMGINAFFTYSLVLGQQIPWPTALAMVFWSGVVFLTLSITPARAAIVKSMPRNIRYGAAVGIGVFLTFIGLKNAGIVVSHPATFVSFGDVNLQTLFFAIGTATILFLISRKSPFAFLVGIAVVTLISIATGQVSLPENFVSSPDFHSVFFKLDFMGALTVSSIAPILAIMFTDLLDSISTFVGLSQSSGLIDKDGEPKNLKEGLVVDAVATAVAGLFGSSSGTTYIESAAGIETGARSGKSAIVTAFLFLPCLFFAPIVGIVPAIATAPVLVVVGFLMFHSVKEISFSNVEEGVPAFLTILLIPLTFSITEGLLWGLVSYVALHIIMGKFSKISKSLLAVSSICLVMLILRLK